MLIKETTKKDQKWDTLIQDAPLWEKCIRKRPFYGTDIRLFIKACVICRLLFFKDISYSSITAIFLIFHTFT